MGYWGVLLERDGKFCLLNRERITVILHMKTKILLCGHLGQYIALFVKHLMGLQTYKGDRGSTVVKVLC